MNRLLVGRLGAIRYELTGAIAVGFRRSGSTRWCGVRNPSAGSQLLRKAGD